jgi:hypothetical protein
MCKTTLDCCRKQRKQREKLCRIVYQTVFSPECLSAFNGTSSVRPSWEAVDGLGDYGDQTGDWYLARNGSNTSDDNTSFTIQGTERHPQIALVLHTFLTVQSTFYQVRVIFGDYRISSEIKDAVVWDVAPIGPCNNRYFGQGDKNLRATNVSSTLIMEDIRSSETSVLIRVTLRNIPEDGILHSQRRDNLKFYIALTCWAL